MRTRKPPKGAIKAAADRAAARSEGKPIEEPKTPITPPIIPAEGIAKAKAAAKTAVKAAAKRKKGRPSKYTPALGRAICKFMVHYRMSLRQIGARPLMPRESTILSWGKNPSHPFSEQFARAREIFYHSMFEDMLEIADDSRNDWMRRELASGVHASVLNDEHLKRTTLRLETRWKILARALPKIYGDKVALEHAGKDGGPIEVAERPQHPGDDHLSEITQRYAVKAHSGLNGHAKPNGKGNGSGLH